MPKIRPRYVVNEKDDRQLEGVDETDYAAAGDVRSNYTINYTLNAVGSDGVRRVVLSGTMGTVGTRLLTNKLADGWYEMLVYYVPVEGATSNPAPLPVTCNVLLVCNSKLCFCTALKGIKPCGCNNKKSREKAMKIRMALDAAEIFFSSGDYVNAQIMMEVIEVDCAGVADGKGCGCS